MLPAPKLARRTVPDGGFERSSRMKNGAATEACRNRRRWDVTASF
jgi:hypothetical protein